MAISINYKNRRSPRAITKFLPFNKGMFHNNHTIQEGFAKVLVNYDLDDAGLSVKPRPGKKYIDQVARAAFLDIKSLDYTFKLYKYGKAHMSSYIYDQDTLRDCVLSFGKYYGRGELLDLIREKYPNISNLTISDTLMKPGYYSSFALRYNTEGSTEYTGGSHSWGVVSRIYEDSAIANDKSNYDPVIQLTQGAFITAKKMLSGAVFDLECSELEVTTPIYTVLNGEIYCFMGGRREGFEADEYEGDAMIGTALDENADRIPEEAYAPVLKKLKISRVNYYPSPVNHLIDVPIEVTEIPIKQIQTTGFNMLKAAPYTSVHYGIVGSALSVDGVLLYSDAACTKPVRSPSKDGNTYLRLYATIDPTATYEIKWEYKNVTASTWTVKTNWTAVDFNTDGFFNPNKVISETFTGVHKTDKFEYRVTLRKTGLVNTEVPYAPLPIECDNPELQKLEYQNFDLTTAEGMFGYKGSLGLYGVEAAKNTIFMSDVENPGYFPFPNNIITFNTDVLTVKPFNGNLLVVTLDGLHIITGGPDPTTMIQKQILSNTYITPLDAMNIQILKDQVFFKTNNQFYVLKPNAKGSDATDLKNYLNSQTIDGYLSNFKENTLSMLNDMYQPYMIANNVQKLNDITYEDVSSGIYRGEVYYTIKMIPSSPFGSIEQVYLHLIYNPITRVWRLNVEAIPNTDAESSSSLRHLDKVTNKLHIFEPVTYFSDRANSYHWNKLVRVVNVLEESNEVVTDGYQYAEQIDGGDIDPDNGFRDPLDMTNARTKSVILDNYQYVDTGNVMLDDTTFKRFREVQFNVYNTSKDVIPFYSNFYVDGVNKLNPLSYTIVHITDTNDPNYGKIFIEENVNYTGSFPENIEIPEDLDITENTEILGETALDFWELDLAAFPDLTTTTVRLTLTGKGRRARLVLLNTSLKQYELSNLAFVYRNMNAR